MVVNDSDTDTCPACRGRGWKLIRPRRALVIGTLIRGLASATRRNCADCEGTGRARGSLPIEVGDNRG